MEKVEPKDRTWIQETKREGQIKRQISKLFKKNYEEKGLTTQSEDDHIHFYTIDDITEAIKTKQFIQQYTDKKVDYHIMHKSELTDMHHIKLLFEKGGLQK